MFYEIEIVNRDTGEAEVWTVTSAHAVQAIRLHCEVSLGEPGHRQYKTMTTILPEGPSITREF